MMRNIVITGIGVFSSVGIGREAYWKGLFEGEPGFKTISLFDTSGLNVHTAGEISDFNPVELLGKKGLRTLDRSTRLINAAAQFAVEDSGIQITDNNDHSIGVSIGTTFGSLHSISQFDRAGLIEGPRYVNPSHFPNTVINSPASQVSIRFKIKGFNTTISTGFCAGLDSVCYAADFVNMKRAEAVLAGGVEELCEETFVGFYNLGCLSGKNGSDPICCPFDARRNGTIFAEGAAVLVIEDEEYAVSRGAHILARVLGYANAFDPAVDSRFRNEGIGLKKAITGALQDASLNSDDIDCISSCANSTEGLDRMETKVIKTVFGDRARHIAVSSIKSMTGETFSASGSLSLASAVGSLYHGIIPPTVNYKESDPECDLDYVPNQARSHKIRTVLVPSSDPYGNNTAIVLGKYRE
jgi:3-oxoacyl-[acyl-carrier-protein] synthase II